MKLESTIKNIILYLKSLLQEIEQLLKNNLLEQAKNKINEYTSYLNDAEIYKLKATYHYQKEEYDTALNVLKEGIQKHPFNFILFLNLGFMCEEYDAMESLKYYAYAMKYSRDEKENEVSLENFNRVVAQYSNNPNISAEKVRDQIAECTVILQEVDAREFPLDQHGKSLMRNVMYEGTDQEYMVNMYKSTLVGDIDSETRLLFKTELFKGHLIKGDIELNLNGPTMVPFSLIEPSTKIDFLMNSTKYPFEANHLPSNRYHYLRFNESGKLKIVSNKPIFVGRPIEISDIPKTPRLALKIFIDGLSFEFLEKHGLNNVMPNTYKFFKEGFISRNTYATSEWTLPSKASINTGLYSTNHKLLHPNFTYHFEKYHKLMAEYLKESGYFTTNICNNWRTTPTFGYYKGFDRILFQNFIGGMDCRDVIMEVIEHLESFSDKNNYLSFSLMDLHNVPDEIENNLYAQVNTDISNRVSSNNKGETSVLSNYDERKIIKYYEEAKRIDVFLGVLFDYIQRKYSNDEILIVLHSDHGQTFLEEGSNILHKSRRKIPLMIKGNHVPELVSDEMIEAIDILPIILKQCGIDIPQDIDGRLPKCFGGDSERTFAVTHVIHPNQPYRCAISDGQHEFMLETQQNVGNDLTINFEAYSIYLLNKDTGEEDKEHYREKVENYEKYIFEQIKDYLRW